MDSKYQYSSLFTSGLLMMPRTGTIVENSLRTPQLDDKPKISRRLSCRLTEPIVVSIPGVTPTQRVTTRRRPSSVLLQLSPQRELPSPFKAIEESHNSTQQRLRASYTSRAAAPSSDTLLSMATSSKSPESNQTTPTRVENMQTRENIGRVNARKPVSPKPKPAPTTPLPELPIARAQGTTRTPFGAIQAQT